MSDCGLPEKQLTDCLKGPRLQAIQNKYPLLLILLKKSIKKIKSKRIFVIKNKQGVTHGLRTALKRFDALG